MEHCSVCGRPSVIKMNGPSGKIKTLCNSCFIEKRKELKKENYKPVFSSLDRIKGK